MPDSAQPAPIGHNQGPDPWTLIVDVITDRTLSIRQKIDAILVDKVLAGGTQSIRDYYLANRQTLADEVQAGKAVQLAKDLRSLRKQLVDIVKEERKPLDDADTMVKRASKLWLTPLDEFGDFVRTAVDSYERQKLEAAQALKRAADQAVVALRQQGTPEAVAKAEVLESRSATDNRDRTRGDHGAMVTAKLVWKVVRITNSEKVDRRYCEPSIKLLQAAIDNAADLGPATLDALRAALGNCCEIRQEVDSRIR